MNYDNVELVDAYEKYLVRDHKKNVDEFFEELTKKANLNVEENHQTIEELNKAKNEEKENASSRRGVTILNATLIITFIVGLIIAAGFFYKAAEPSFLGFYLPLYLSIIIGVISLIASITAISFSLTVVKKKANEYDQIINQLKRLIGELTQKADQQMAPLNDLFNWNQPMQLFEKTIPLIKLDEHFNSHRWDYLVKRYDLKNIPANENITFVQSGEVHGNPFLFIEKIAQSMFLKTYTGSITISWTETYKDADGKTQTRTKSEVLTASLQANAPQYDKDYYVIYGNEAAPNLSFSRRPTGAPYYNEKSLTNFIESQTKSLQKIATKAVKKGSGFNLLTNNEFEALYHAIDRDNEIEFRLLFTPVAQRQMIKLFKSAQGYGDYFQFYKEKKINYTYSRQLKIKNLETNVKDFQTNDYQKTKANFAEFNAQYFDSIFFSLIPSLAIPLYQQLKPREYIYEEDYGQVSSPWEYEVLARKHQVNFLKHPQAATTNIFKTQILEHDKNVDKVAVTASAFKTMKRVTTFEVHGRDGNYHTVPVHWIEYLPVKKTTNIVVQQTENYDLNKFHQQQKTTTWSDYFDQYHVENHGIIFHRNLVSFISGDEMVDYQKLDNLIKGE